MSLRKDFADALRTHANLPKGWKVYPYAHVPGGAATKPVVCVQQKTVRPTPGAPGLYQDAGFDVLLLEPNLDPEGAEDALEADIETLIELLEALDFPGLLWTEAERVLFDGKYHGWTVTTTITNTKE